MMDIKEIIKPENLVYSKSKVQIDTITHYCPGCTHGVVHKLISELIDEMGLQEKTVGVAPVGCAVFAYNYIDIDWQEAAHGRAPAVATGIVRLNPDKFVFTYQGDGDLASIGAAEIIHACNRGENILVVFINNGIYGMTGGQMAPTTMPGQKTETSPYGRDADTTGSPTQGPEMVAAIAPEGAYVARGSVANMKQLKNYIKKALENQMAGNGFSFVEALSLCPTNWRTNAKDTWKFLEEDMYKYFKVGELRVPGPREKEGQ